MLQSLIKNGIGNRMLQALINMYSYTKFFLEGAGEAETNKGIRQGAASSCYLFIIFINGLIQYMKSSFDFEPVIKDFTHFCMLMML